MGDQAELMINSPWRTLLDSRQQWAPAPCTEESTSRPYSSNSQSSLKIANNQQNSIRCCSRFWWNAKRAKVFCFFFPLLILRQGKKENNFCCEGCRRKKKRNRVALNVFIHVSYKLMGAFAHWSNAKNCNSFCSVGGFFWKSDSRKKEWLSLATQGTS